MAEIKLRPLGDRVVIEPTEQDEKTASGIILPETAKEKPQQGKVLAVGPGRLDDEGKRLPLEVKVGDLVLFPKYGGSEVKLSSDRKVMVMKESEVLAIIES